MTRLQSLLQPASMQGVKEKTAKNATQPGAGGTDVIQRIRAYALLSMDASLWNPRR